VNKLKFSTLILITFAQISLAHGSQNIQRNELAHKLSDCGSFFGLLSQTKSSYAEAMKAFSLASIVYAQTAFNDDAAFTDSAKLSTKKAADLITKIQDSNDNSLLENEYTQCTTTLASAEKSLRPELSDLNKSIVPEFFK
jgi:hypothetical protein